MNSVCVNLSSDQKHVGSRNEGWNTSAVHNIAQLSHRNLSACKNQARKMDVNWMELVSKWNQGVLFIHTCMLSLFQSYDYYRICKYYIFKHYICHLRLLKDEVYSRENIISRKYGSSPRYVILSSVAALVCLIRELSQSWVLLAF